MANRRFSIGEALGEPFRLAGRRPFTIFVWGLLSLAPLLAVLPMMGEMWSPDFWTDMARDEGSLFDPATMQTFWKWQIVSQLSNLLQILVWVVVTAAVFRAVLRPGDAARRPFALGLGMDELRIAVVCLAVGVGLFAVVAATGLIGAGVVASVWSMGEAVRGWAIGGLVVLVLFVLVVGFGRVSLMAPASVAERDFAFESGWRLARGQVVRVILLTLAVWILTMVIAVAAYAVVALIGWGVWMGLGLGWPDSVEDARAMVMSDWRLWLVAVVTVVPLLWLYGLLNALTAAPYASAVKQLTPAPAADAPVSGDATES